MEHAPAAAWPHPVRHRRPARLLRLAGDERLVAFVRGGDEGAFEAIFDRYHRPILGFCRHMVGSREEAEDAVQHTFLAAYRDLVDSAKPIELRPWLFAIARNRCLSILRARREQVALDAVEPSTEGLTAAVERREDLREMLGDLSRLPEDQRAALLLSELGALDHEGIATVLGCRREKVKALVFQARSSLAASRQARATPCAEIREQLASATGSALRRGPLRRHVRECPGCRAFQAEVSRQRKLMAIALPVLPTAALKAASLPGGGAAAGHAVAGAGAAGAGAGATATSIGSGGALTAIASAGAAKVAVSMLAAAAIAGGGAAALHATRGGAHVPNATPHVPSSASAATASPVAQLLGAAGGMSASASSPAGTVPPRSATALGFLPTRVPGPGGNGAAARAFARTRGGSPATVRPGHAGHGPATAPTTRSAPPASSRRPPTSPAPAKRHARRPAPARSGTRTTPSAGASPTHRAGNDGTRTTGGHDATPAAPPSAATTTPTVPTG
jgi:RNA polymerase sigma factor (sigma-70 family)